MLRLFDFMFALIAIFILSPVILMICVVLRFSGEGEVFFLQDRVGKGGGHFKLYKFVTMLKDSPNMGSGTVTLKNDPRILPIGGCLRRTKLNELPQLWNVLKGDMSLVGPRPQAPANFSSFPRELQSVIVSQRPGLSGLGSIIFRDEEQILESVGGDPLHLYNNVIAPYKGIVEAWYAKNSSIWNYFLVIFCTVVVIISPSSSVVWRIFRNIPYPPESLRGYLKFRV